MGSIFVKPQSLQQTNTRNSSAQSTPQTLLTSLPSTISLKQVSSRSKEIVLVSCWSGLENVPINSFFIPCAAAHAEEAFARTRKSIRGGRRGYFWNVSETSVSYTARVKPVWPSPLYPERRQGSTSLWLKQPRPLYPRSGFAVQMLLHSYKIDIFNCTSPSRHGKEITITYCQKTSSINWPIWVWRPSYPKCWDEVIVPKCCYVFFGE